MTLRAAAPRVCFIAERQVGIGSIAAAIEPHARGHANVTWVDVTYWQPGGVIERLPLPGRAGGTLRGFLQTGAALRLGPFDALLFLTQNPAVLRQWAIGRTPTLLWTDVTPAQLDALGHLYGHPVDKPGLAKSVKHALVRRAFHRAALCVGWSDWARRSLVADYSVPEDRTGVLPPGIDLSRWIPTPRSAAADLPRLLFVGGDFDRKGGPLLLDVFRNHLRGRCVLDIVTREAVMEEGDVRVHRGLTADSAALKALYQAASVFVLPTRGDCSPIVSIEAMAMGLPVVASSLGGIPEIVEPEGSGYLVTPGDGAELRAALETLLVHPERRRAMGLRGRALVEDRFDARKVTDKIFTLLASIERRA